MTTIPIERFREFAARPSEETFRPIYEESRRLVWTLCRRLLRDPADASDAFQSTYCRLLAAAREGRGPSEGEDSLRLLCRAAIREADRIRKRRSRRAVREVPLGEEEPMNHRQLSPEDAAAREEVRERVEALVEALPERYRLPLQLHFFHGLSQREVARALDQPPSTVAERVKKGLGKLAPEFRRAGLKDAVATLAGIAVGGVLLEPSLSAAAVFAQAEAAGSLAAAGLEAGWIFKAQGLLQGVAIVKASTAIIIVLVLLLAGAILLSRARSRPPVAAPLASSAPADGEDRPPAASARIASSPRTEEVRSEPSPLQVKVVWRQTSEPATGARVTFRSGRGQPAAEEFQVDESGLLLLAAPAGWKTAWLEARHPEGLLEEAEVSLPSGEAVTISLRRDVITGAVLDAETGQPLPGAVVRAGSREAVADASGVYLLPGLGWGLHDLKASAAGHAAAPARVNHADPGESLQDFRLDPALEVLVSVVGEDGSPIAGARVVPSVFGSDGAYLFDDGADTDPRGQARLSGVSRLHPPSIQAHREGYRSAYGRPEAGPDPKQAELKLVLEKVQSRGRLIVGRVTDPEGRAIAGAIVEWKDGESTSYGDGVQYGQWKARTDRGGNYRLEYSDPSERCNLAVAARGRAPVIARGVRAGSAEEPAEKNFTLEPGHWLRGRVLDEESRPLEGVEVRVMASPDLLQEGVAYPAALRETKTDGQGGFELQDLPGPRAAVQLRCRCDSPIQREEITLDREADLVMKGYGVIRGRVVDGGSGEPVAAFRVRLKGLKGGVSSQEWNPGLSFTSSDGSFLLKRLDRNGLFGIIVEAEGFISGELEPLEPQAEAKAEERLISLSRGRALEGVVVDAATGAPLQGIQVGVSGKKDARELLSFPLGWDSALELPGFRKTVTPESGEFLFLEDRPENLLIRSKSYRRLFITPEARADFRGPDGRLRIPLERGEGLRGIFYQDGRPRAGVELRLLRLGDPPAPGGVAREEPYGFAESDGDGRFSWHDLAPGGYLLEYEKRPGEPRPETALKIRRRIEVKPGEETELALGRDLGPLALRGRITGLEGHVTVWANLVLRPLFEESGEEIVVPTYRDWGWKIACPYLRPGKYAAEVQFYTRQGVRAVPLPPLELAQDLERDLEVQPGGE
jgi:RNA polymerase sigma-70 factor (ECF subfamily)